MKLIISAFNDNKTIEENNSQHLKLKKMLDSYNKLISNNFITYEDCIGKHKGKKELSLLIKCSKADLRLMQYLAFIIFNQESILELEVYFMHEHGKIWQAGNTPHYIGAWTEISAQEAEQCEYATQVVNTGKWYTCKQRGE